MTEGRKFSFSLKTSQTIMLLICFQSTATHILLSMMAFRDSVCCPCRAYDITKFHWGNLSLLSRHFYSSEQERVTLLALFTHSILILMLIYPPFKNIRRFLPTLLPMPVNLLLPISNYCRAIGSVLLRPPVNQHMVVSWNDRFP